MEEGPKTAVEERASSEDLEGLDLSRLHNMTGFLVRIVQLQIFQHFFETFSGRGVTTGGYTALVAIHDNPGIQQGVLADCLLIKRSNMTKLINSLEARGLVERRVSLSDKRAVDLHVSPKGETLLGQIENDVARHDRDVTRALSSAERAQLLGYLSRISKDLRARGRIEG